MSSRRTLFMRCALVCSASICLALLAGIGPALAQRPSTTMLTCAQARAVVTRQGAAVLGTGGPTFDRFVRDRSFCEATEIGRRAFVPTRDNSGCFVGYTCYEPGPGDRFGDF